MREEQLSAAATATAAPVRWLADVEHVWGGWACGFYSDIVMVCSGG